MITLTVGSNMNKKDVIVDETTTTPTQALADNNVSTKGASLFLNGMPLGVNDLNKTLSDLDCDEDEAATLIAVVKADSAK